MEQQTKVNNERLAIVTAVYDAHNHREFDYQVKRLMHFKAAAAYAVKIIEDPKNYWFTAWASPMWNIPLSIFDDTGTEIAGFGSKSSKYWTAIESIADLYAAVMYVFAAMREARQRVIAIGQQEMTPAEIEREFGLSRGTVRKYIFDNRQTLEETGVIRQADKRTVLCKRGWAICRWGNKK
jgi:hypothetical protein